MVVVQRTVLVSTVIDSAIEVHRALGPGLLESVYKTFLVHELTLRGVRVEREVPVPVVYKGARVDCGFRLDLLVDGTLICEVKSVDRLAPLHTAQVITYLRLTGAPQALLLNFNGATLKEGLRSFLAPRNTPTHTGVTPGNIVPRTSP